MNPYAKYLGTQDPKTIIATTAGRLQAAMSDIGREGADTAPAPGKWSPREIACHLADTEIAFSFRLRQALAEPHYVIQPFDQDSWAKHYGAYDLHGALQLFRALREWNVRLIQAVPEAAYSRPVTHPERGEMTFRVLLETMAGHDINHLQQLESIAGKRGAS